MIRKASCFDAPVIARLALQMWQEHSQDELTNNESLHFHLHCGFVEANRIICFTEKL